MMLLLDKELKDKSIREKAVALHSFQQKLLEKEQVDVNPFLSLEETLQFSKLFKEQFVMEKMSLQTLQLVCRLLGIEPYKSHSHVVLQLRRHLMMTKREDREIMWEGVHSLSHEELVEACKERGMLFYGISDDAMRQQMTSWLALSSHREIPPLLLLWSRCITMTHSAIEIEGIESSAATVLPSYTDFTASAAEEAALLAEQKKNEAIAAAAAADAAAAAAAAKREEAQVAAMSAKIISSSEAAFVTDLSSEWLIAGTGSDGLGSTTATDPSTADGAKVSADGSAAASADASAAMSPPPTVPSHTIASLATAEATATVADTGADTAALSAFSSTGGTISRVTKGGLEAERGGKSLGVSRP
eukprot:GHVQ01003847.1.p2 GENE.GHVQ01003847.1~~GHVQ01003847.1.p2  ORF type:complete len:360 (+),score=89.68 GHVQ01003847.1:1601-2680(+)